MKEKKKSASPKKKLRLWGIDAIDAIEAIEGVEEIVWGFFEQRDSPLSKFFGGCGGGGG